MPHSQAHELVKELQDTSETKLALSDPESWVDQHGDDLFRFAVRRVRDSEVAQDLVQETFVAALEARDRFAGRSPEKSWLVGILKHKLSDHFRKTSRECVPDDAGQLEDAREDEGVFDQNGHWKSNLTAPKEWPSDPSRLVEQKEFWRALNRGLSELSPRMARVFRLREVDGLSTEEICRLLNISSANLFVILHRARMHLRHSLESHLVESGRGHLKPSLTEVLAA